jgi:hypothetical protein
MKSTSGAAINFPPVEAPPETKASDFRYSPPAVEDMQFKRLENGNALAMVRFARDRRLGREVALPLSDGQVILRDDGTGGDAVAGDGVFSAIVPGGVIDEVAAEQDQVVSLASRSREPLRVPIFHGRDLVGTKEVRVEDFMPARQNQVFKMPPFGILGLQVNAKRSLMITDTAVTNDPNRTFNPCSATPGTPMGKWTFGYLVTQMANQAATGVDPADLVMQWLLTWRATQTVNSFAVAPRTGMLAVIDQWPRQPNGKLDLARAPLKLLAIVNRIDLATNMTYGPGGGAEGRFVFGFVDPSCHFRLANVILEYGVPIHDCQGLQAWAKKWLALGSLVPGSDAYEAELESITETFAGVNADPSKPNGSSLDQVRTDEATVVLPWELREFHLGDDHFLHQATIAQTPDTSFDNAGPHVGGAHSAELVAWVNENALAIEQDQDTVPLTFPLYPSRHFRGAAVGNEIDFWNGSGIVTEAARHHLSLNTCDGCHGTETNTIFLQIMAPPLTNEEAELSGFLTGGSANVPVAGGQYTYNELARRAQVLAADASTGCILHLPVPVILMPD